MHQDSQQFGEGHSLNWRSADSLVCGMDCSCGAQSHFITLACRVTDSLMQHGRNNGKKMMAVRIIKHAFEIIHLLTDQNPIQVLVDAIINRCSQYPFCIDDFHTRERVAQLQIPTETFLLLCLSDAVCQCISGSWWMPASTDAAQLCRSAQKLAAAVDQKWF